MDKLKIYNAKWASRSAGPSPDDMRRTEIFLAGCSMALSGHPCKGCFNPELWDPKNCCDESTVKDAYNRIEDFSPNHYITFVGGEPLDQIKPLAALCELLHDDGYHIIVITHYTLEDIIHKAEDLDGDYEPYRLLLKNIDGMIDGAYDSNQRIWDEDKAGDGVHDVIGSGNQKVIDLKARRRGAAAEDCIVEAKNLEALALVNDEFVFLMKEEGGRKDVREALRA